MTGGRPVAEKYLQSMTEVKNGRMSTAWRLLPINAHGAMHFPVHLILELCAMPTFRY